MSTQGDYEVTEAMITYGGSFASALGRLLRLADPDNQRRLVAAFPELIEQYREIARLRPSQPARADYHHGQ